MKWTTTRLVLVAMPLIAVGALVAYYATRPKADTITLQPDADGCVGTLALYYKSVESSKVDIDPHVEFTTEKVKAKLGATQAGETKAERSVTTDSTADAVRQRCYPVCTLWAKTKDEERKVLFEKLTGCLQTAWETAPTHADASSTSVSPPPPDASAGTTSGHPVNTLGMGTGGTTLPECGGGNAERSLKAILQGTKPTQNLSVTATLGPSGRFEKANVNAGPADLKGKVESRQAVAQGACKPVEVTATAEATQ